MASISQASIDGFAKSASYDTHRPSYPTDAVELLLKKLGVVGVDGLRILDLGAGTGKFTEILAQRPEQFNIVAVEPHDDMAAVLREKQLHNVDIRSGEARNIPAEDQSFDAVIAAQVCLGEKPATKNLLGAYTEYVAIVVLPLVSSIDVQRWRIWWLKERNYILGSLRRKHCKRFIEF